MRRKYIYESEEVRKEFRKLSDKLYRAVKRGTISSDLMTAVRDVLSGYENITHEDVEKFNELYYQTRETSKSEAIDYTYLVDDLYQYIENQPDVLEGISRKRTTYDSRTGQWMPSTELYLNYGKQIAQRWFENTLHELGDKKFGEILYNNPELISQFKAVIEYGYKANDSQYEALGGYLSQFYDSGYEYDYVESLTEDYEYDETEG